MALALARGRPVPASAAAAAAGEGVYYVSDGGVYAWEEVLREVGRALGRPNTLVVPVPEAVSWGAGLVGELAARVTGKPRIVSLDKVREISGDGWACDDARARAELGYAPAWPLVKGLAETARWYRESGWI
jgi:nucleoside-diphosphate-sugar epimerase